MPLGYTHPNSWLREDEDFDRYNRPGSPDWFDLSGDVSFAKPNNRHDALKVESLLGYGGYLDLEKGGGPLGLSSLKLEEPIKRFQEKNGLKVDGLLKPGGPTIRKMKELYGGVFGGTPAPTPAMVDAHVEQVDAGAEGFLHDVSPKFGVRPNPRLDGKAHLMEYERWNRDWARGSGHDPKGLAPEYESYIRDLDQDHGHDPGLVFARDLTRQVEKFHGKGSEMAKHLVMRLGDRPDLQRELLGGPVPTSPPIGTFKDGTGDGAKAWIDQDRIANGFKPKYAKAVAAQAEAPVLRTSSRAEPAPNAGPDPNNLLEYGPNFGLPEDSALQQQPPHAPDLPNPRPTDPPAQSDSERKPDENPEPPHVPSAGEVDPNQMTPMPKPPKAETPANKPERPASRPDPKTLPLDRLENALQNAQISLDARSESLRAAIKAYDDARQAREFKEAEGLRSLVVDVVKGAIDGVAKAELDRTTRPGGDRIVGGARWRNNARGAGKGMAKAVPPNQQRQMSLADLKSAEAAALEAQNRALEDQRDMLERRDELLRESEARRRVRPDQ